MKADLHVHTCYSQDGKSTPQQVVETAKARGIKCIAITDHNSFEAYKEVIDNGEVIIIPGEEVSSSKGHIVALGIDRYIERGLSVEETVKRIHEAGGLAIVAHPYRPFNGLGPKNIIPEFDGIEALNARSKKRGNGLSYKLAKEYGKIMTAGSDAHVPKYIGDGYIDMRDCSTWQEVIEELRSGGQVIPHSKNHSTIANILFNVKTFFCWTFRGFRNM